MPVIQLELDSKGAISSLQKFDNAVDATAVKTETSFSKMRQGINDFGKVAGIALAAATAAVVAFGLRALESGARMEETQNKYNVVFDGLIEKSDQWVHELRKNYALSERAAKEYLSSTKAIIDGTNLETEAAAKLSNQVVLLAQDLASFHDKSPEQAVNAMTSALTGEYEAMKQFGVVIKKTQVIQKAMTENQLESKDAVTQAMEAQAAYTLILEKSGKAQGDTIRSQESYTFQLKQSKAILEDLVTAIGMKLLPVGTQILKLFNTWAIEQDGVTRALNITIEAIRFFDNGVRGLMLTAKGATVAIAYGFDVVAQAVAMLLSPLSMAIDGMVALGLVDSNPIRQLTEFTNDFLQAQIEGFNATYEGIVKQNQMYDSLKETVRTTSATVQDAGNVARTEAATTAATTQGTWQNSVESLGNSYDVVAQKAAAAGAAARNAAALGSGLEGVTRNETGYEWESPDGSTSSAGYGTAPGAGGSYSGPGGFGGQATGDPDSAANVDSAANLARGASITNNFNQNISRSDIANIVSEQQRTGARL